MNETTFPMPLCKLLIWRLTLYLREEYIPHIAQAHRGLPAIYIYNIIGHIELWQSYD